MIDAIAAAQIRLLRDLVREHVSAWQHHGRCHNERGSVRDGFERDRQALLDRSRRVLDSTEAP